MADRLLRYEVLAGCGPQHTPLKICSRGWWLLAQASKRVLFDDAIVIFLQRLLAAAFLRWISHHEIKLGSQTSVSHASLNKFLFKNAKADP